jgi:hypothetical protein
MDTLHYPSPVDFSRFVKLMDFQTEKSIIRHELGLGENEIVIGGCFRFVVPDL